MMNAPNGSLSATITRSVPAGAAQPVLTATTDPRVLVRYLHHEVKLTDRELEKVTGTHRVTIRRWRSKQDHSEPRDTGRLDDLRVIVGLLVNSGVLNAEEAGRFLRSRDEHLDHLPPLAFLTYTEDETRREKDFRRVLEVTQTLVDRMLVTNN